MIATPLAAELAAAQSLMQSGRPMAAVPGLEQLRQRNPRSLDVHVLLAMAHWRSGDLPHALGVVQSAQGLGKRDAQFQALAGQIYLSTGLTGESERAFRAALTVDRRLASAAIGLSELLIGLGRPQEALQVTAPLLSGRAPDAAVLAAHGNAQHASGHTLASLDTFGRAVTAAPTSGVAEHNLAARLGDLSYFPEAEAAASRAFAKGLDAPETWLVYGRALQGQNRFAEAKAAYERALGGQRPCAEAHLDLAQLIWMQTGDLLAASAALDAALTREPARIDLALYRAKLHSFAGDRLGAYEALADCIARQGSPVLILEVEAGNAALLLGELDTALGHAVNAAKFAPSDVNQLQLTTDVHLAAGQLDQAETALSHLTRLSPDDQSVVARQAVIWRLRGDPRYKALYDYDRNVRTFTLETPSGWSSLTAYLSDLRTVLNDMHDLVTHPLGQSVRGGSQTMQNLSRAPSPVLRAFFAAIDEPICRYIADLGPGKDSLRRRNQGGYALGGNWSVSLRSSGFHTDHVHPKGWISSAFYVSTPDAVEAGGHEGWLKFGQPGIATQPPLEAEHWIKPEPGTLVLFPSHMWHGTEPFTSQERRLSIAFDLLAAKPNRR